MIGSGEDLIVTGGYNDSTDPGFSSTEVSHWTRSGPSAWTSGPEMLSSRAWHSAAHSAGIIYVSGGVVGDGSVDALESVERLLFTSEAFVRGDCNGIGNIDLADAITLLNYLFNEAERPSCADACDVNDDGGLNMADPVYLLIGLFEGGPPPWAPWPMCGVDPTGDSLGCEGSVACG